MGDLLHVMRTDKAAKVLVGVSGCIVCAWIRRLLKQPWAPFRAELEIARIILWDGVRRILWASGYDGSRALDLKQRFERVNELRAILVVERNRQIDVARRRALCCHGWGKTVGTHHMQHLPGLVFRGEDQAIVRESLQRAARLFGSPLEGLRLHQEWEQTPVMKDVVLVGGGHAHVHVLRMLGMEPLPGVRVTLVTRDVETPYSGMLPGHVAGLYTRQECHLDLNVLARFARARLVCATVVGIDVEKKHVLLSDDRPPIAYDVLSINVGSAPKVQPDASAVGVTPVKPIDGFGARWEDILSRIPTWTGARRLLVVGGGAGGFELAVSMHARLAKEMRTSSKGCELTVALVTRGRLLSYHSPGVRALAEKTLRERGIELHVGFEATSAASGILHCRDGRTLAYDECIWCTQGKPQAWIQECGLQTDPDGFLLVDQQMHCRYATSDCDIGPIFAAGDVASIRDHPRPKAGVFAVMASMTLWHNIRATLRGETLVTYWPQISFLNLIGLGDGTCIASRGNLAIKSTWLWDLKDWIDRRWMWNYLEGLPEMPSASHGGSSAGSSVAAAAGPGALSLLRHAVMRCGGCGAKVGATTLRQAMSRVRVSDQPAAEAQAKVVVGVGDDAAVVELTADSGIGKVASVQTIDFFRSFVEDLYLFGRIAAIHALSDCEAMGAVPQTALALVQVPYAFEEKQEEDLVQLMSGAAAALREVGCALVGGHTCEARELGLGFSITGRLPGGCSSALTKSAMQVGDAVVLTKPLGTGTLFAADMRAKARGRWILPALRSMATSNSKASQILRDFGAGACTDITGFGLVGHMLEMCRGSGVEVTVDLSNVPFYDGALACLEMGIASSLQPANVRLRRAIANHEEVKHLPAYPLLFDPQTSGGLLAAVPPERAEACVEALRSSGAAPHAAVVGKVTDNAECDCVEMIRVSA